MRVILSVTAGPKWGTEFVFDTHRVVLFGRSHRCGQYSLGNDLRMSRAHLIVEVDPPVCRLRDLGSANRSFVNGRPVIEAQIGHGDVVTLGDTQLTVRVEQTSAEVMAGDQARWPAVVAESWAESPPAASAPAIERPCVRCGAATRLPGPTADLPVCPSCRQVMQTSGEHLSSYRLVSQIYQGSMGAVWQGEDVRTARRVAVKLLGPDLAGNPRLAHLFLQASHLAAGLRHPRIAEAITSGQFDGQLFAVTEYVAGQDAETVCQQSGGRMNPRDVIAIALQTLDAIEYAHSQGVVHRDLKPRNLLLQGAPDSYAVKVTDFGLARNYLSAGLRGLTQDPGVRSSIPYLAHEQVIDPESADPRSDVFGLGATFYHLLTGEFVYNFVPDQEPLVTVVEAEPVDIRTRGVPLPPQLVDVINRAISESPDSRFQTVGEMRAALAAIPEWTT